MGNLVYKLRGIGKITTLSPDIKFVYPNIVGVINCPEIPARGYIFDINLKEVYGDTETAARHFIERSKKIYTRNFIFLLGFVQGDDWNKATPPTNRFDRDIIYMEILHSADRFKTRPYMVKGQVGVDSIGDGSIQTTTPYIKGDMQVVSGKEMASLIIKYPDKFDELKDNFPRLPEEWGLEYKEEQIFTCP